MHWQHPAAFYLLWLAPAWIGLALYARGKRRSAATKFVSSAMQPQLLPREHVGYFWCKTGLKALAVIGLVLALARPRWGEYFMPIQQRGCDLYILLDVSRSMLATDVKPSRLERAKADIQVLQGRLKGERLGLIAFAGKPTLKCPLTSDYGFFRLALDEANVGSAPRGGTAIGDAIRKALEVLPRDASRDQALLLITDGDDQTSYPLEAADAAAERKVLIFTVGLGDATQGALIPGKQAGTVMTQGGKEVLSKLDGTLLGEIAQRTKGAYVPAGTRSYDLGELYTDQLSLLRGDPEVAQRRKRLNEHFQLPLGAALFFLLAEMLIPLYQSTGRPRPVLDARPSKTKRPVAASVAALVWLGCIVATPTTLGGESAVPTPAPETGKTPDTPEPPAASGQDAVTLVRAGLALYGKSEYEGAREKFSAAEALALEDERPTVTFDLGTALHKQGEKDLAANHYQDAGLAKDKRLAASARFNLGCLEAEGARKLAGEKPEDAGQEERKKITADLLQAAGQYRACLELDATHVGARKNLELIRLWLKYHEELWRKKDREKRRNEMDLLRFLEYLIQTQQTLKVGSEALARTPDAPLDAHAEVKRAQKDLEAEVPPLKEKIQEAAKPPPGQQASTDAQTQHALGKLLEWADEAGAHMLAASNQLGTRNGAAAAVEQHLAIEALEKIWEAVVPFRPLLAHALEKQTALASTLKPTDNPSPPPVGLPKGSAQDAEENKQLSEVQNQTRHRTQLLRDKAAVELEVLKQTPLPEPSPQPQPQPGQTPTPDPEKTKAGLEKALELAPQAVTHQEGALRELRKDHRDKAHPEAEAARKLLEEILKAQPQDPQQDKKDEKDKQDNPDKKEQDPQEKQAEQKTKDPQDPKNQGMTPEQAEALLRRVREREQERRRKLDDLRRFMVQPEEVEKDW